MRAFRRKWIFVVVIALVVIGLTIRGFHYFKRRAIHKHEENLAHTPEAPPDLEKLRAQYSAGITAIRKDDGATAVQELNNFSFGKRAVEEYRLYHSGRALELTNNRGLARRTLAHLWERPP